VEDAVRLYVATAVGQDGDDDITDARVRWGVPAAAAARLCVLVPLAFGRVLLGPGVPLSDRYGFEGIERPLSGEPEFTAALAFARRVSRAALQSIGQRSAEVDVVNRFPPGTRADSLVYTAPYLTSPLPPPLLPYPVSFGAHDLLARLGRHHGVEGRWELGLSPLAISSEQTRLKLDVVVPVGTRLLVESVVDSGADMAGAVEATMSKLANASFPVLHAAFGDESRGADRVLWDRWGAWRACVGPLMEQYSRVPDLRFDEFVDHLRARLLPRGLTPEPHWVRVFHARRAGTVLASEVLLDNVSCPDLQADLDAWPWPRTREAHAFRCFFVLLPTTS
jgi:hypothetical protein